MSVEHLNPSAPRTHFVRKDLPPPRRRLAPNVPCMFEDERPPVVNVPRRGRLPKAITKLRDVRMARYLASLPKPHEYKLGDDVEVEFPGGKWIPATISGFVHEDGHKRFRLISYKELFPFGDHLSATCIAYAQNLRPIE